MATTTRRPLPTLKIKKLPPPRLQSPEKSTQSKSKYTREVNPLEKRLVNIRLHLLQNTIRRTQAPSEPTLVYDPFLYLGGLKSLSNKVKIIKLCFTSLSSDNISIFNSASTNTPENISYTLGRFCPTSTNIDSI